ncbi:MAG: metallophosphoesterase, partial [Gammaproteobacteria bacterium]|nr:metallophosphoesterase [Gammaproteobacteria bacterium]
MSDYIIGDVQGCYDSLINLLDKIHFSSEKDRIFFLGDIVNRGPDSLKTLRFIANLEDNAKMVIGNHDFHLIACALGSKRQNKKDTFSDILQAKDKHKLIDFLLSKPLVIAENDALLVHAGSPPNWDRNMT